MNYPPEDEGTAEFVDKLFKGGDFELQEQAVPMNEAKGAFRAYGPLDFPREVHMSAEELEFLQTHDRTPRVNDSATTSNTDQPADGTPSDIICDTLPQGGLDAKGFMSSPFTTTPSTINNNSVFSTRIHPLISPLVVNGLAAVKMFRQRADEHETVNWIRDAYIQAARAKYYLTLGQTAWAYLLEHMREDLLFTICRVVGMERCPQNAADTISRAMPLLLSLPIIFKDHFHYPEPLGNEEVMAEDRYKSQTGHQTMHNDQFTISEFHTDDEVRARVIEAERALLHRAVQCVISAGDHDGSGLLDEVRLLLETKIGIDCKISLLTKALFCWPDAKFKVSSPILADFIVGHKLYLEHGDLGAPRINQADAKNDQYIPIEHEETGMGAVQSDSDDIDPWFGMRRADSYMPDDRGEDQGYDMRGIGPFMPNENESHPYQKSTRTDESWSTEPEYEINKQVRRKRYHPDTYLESLRKNEDADLQQAIIQSHASAAEGEQRYQRQAALENTNDVSYVMMADAEEVDVTEEDEDAEGNEDAECVEDSDYEDAGSNTLMLSKHGEQDRSSGYHVGRL